MIQITAAEVNKLRHTTGAGMMDCKRALQDANGDFDKAIEIIREKGIAVANKRADKEAKEGVCLAKVNADATKGAIIALNCETDFVAINEKFLTFANAILDCALTNLPADLESFKNLKFNDKATVAEAVTEQVGIIGEKIELNFYNKIEAPEVVAYIHMGNKLSTLVAFSKKVSDHQVAKDVAMQVAAMSPIAVDKEDVPQEVADKELEIGRIQAKNEGKPENMLDKIAMGKLSKFYKESTLLNQEFIKDSKQTIKQYLQNADKELKVLKFIRYSLKD